jgi:hypothetical protein
VATSWLIALHGGGLDHVAADVDRGLFEERIENRGGRIERQDHVRLVDAFPAGDRGPVEHLAVAEQVLVHELGGNGDVLLFAPRIGEAEVGELDLFFFDQLEYVTRCLRHIGLRKRVLLCWREDSVHFNGGLLFPARA